MDEWSEYSDSELQERYDILEGECAELRDDLYLVERDLDNIEKEMYRRKNK